MRHTLVLFFALAFTCLSPDAFGITDNYSTGPATGGPDTLDDVWQSIHNAWGLSASGDEDYDGCSNYVESLAGTDPRNSTDCLAVGNMAISAGSVVVTFKAEKGKKYQVWESDTPVGAPPASGWTMVSGASKISTQDHANDTIVFTKPVNSRKFYRLESLDADSDGDGVSDWAENKLGMDPAIASSTGNGATDGDTLASLLSLTVQSTTNGFEKDDKTAPSPAAVPGKLKLVRTVGTMALNGLSLIGAPGAPAAEKSSATPPGTGADYTLATFSIPAGQGVPGTPYDAAVTPVQDALDEVPEYAKITVDLPGSITAAGPSGTLCICDSDPANPANNQLYVAYLGHEAGQATTASGYATALVKGDNTSASISIVFSNLSSEQNTAYIRSGPNSDLAPALPNGQVSGTTYNIEYKPGFYSTDQGFLDALRTSNIWCAITSANFTGKEIAGPFNKATGSITFDPDNPTLDAPVTGSSSWQTATNEQIERDIWRFMNQCTWGGTQAMYIAIRGKVDARIGALSGTPTAAQITDAYIQGLSDWLDEQMNPALTPTVNFRTLVMAADNEEFEMRGNKPYTYSNDPSFNGTRYAVTFDNAGNPTVSTTADNNFAGNNYPQSGPNRRREWWSIMLQGKDQVRQRFTQALSEIVIISEADQTVLDRHYGCANYWDMLAENAFGKYRTLLEKVTYSPMMGVYLSHMANRAAYDAGGGIIVSPDENYAREIMQLFSIGLVLRHPDGSLQLDSAGLPIPTYDQRDITELARVMTGFSHGARHAIGYTSSWNSSTLLFNNSSNNRVSDLVVFNYNSSVTAANFSNGNNNWFGRADDHLFWAAPWTTPMKVIGRISDATPTTVGSIYYHDFNQYVDPDTGDPVANVSKRLLAGKHGQYDIPMRSLPALGRGANDITCHNLADLDLTAAHNALAGDPTQSTYGAGTQASPGHTNTPVNMCRWLIQRLVTSNPSAGYIFRVQEVYRNTNGNLGAVLKAMLLDYEARSLQLADSSISHGKVKEPLVAFTQMLRTLRAFSGAPISILKDQVPNMSGTDTPMPTAYPLSEYNKFSIDNANPPSLPTGWATGPFRYRFGDLTSNIGQSPQRPPSVFNWFLPDYVVPGPMAEAGLFAPELQINTEASVVAKANMFYAYTWSNLTGMSTQPGADTNVSDFILNNGNATPAVRLSLDGGVTFVNSITFTPTDFSAKTVTVVGGNTNWLSNVDNSLLRFSVSGAAGYDALPVAPMTIGFQDTDSANEGIRAEHTSFNTWVQEGVGGKTDIVNVRLHSPPPAGSTVDVNITTGGQVSVSPTTVSFNDTDWNTVKTVTVSAVEDAVTEAPSAVGDTLTFTASSAAASYNGLTATLPVGVVDNDDGASSFHVLVTEVGSDTVVGESSTQTTVLANVVDNFNIVLTRQPSANVTVTITPSNTQVQLNTTTGGTTYGAAGAAVTRTFTNVNWATAQEVRVRGNADTTAEGSFEQNPTNNAIITITANGGGYLTANPVQQVVAKILDDDNRIIMTPSGGETIVQEGGIADTFTVQLRVNPTVPVTVNLGSNHVRCTPTNLVFHPTGGTPGPGETIWNVAQTVTVTAIDDHLNEGRMMPLTPNAIPTVATATSTVASGALTALTMTNQGAGYTVPPIVSFSGGGGSGAAASPVLSADGRITGLTITAAGSAYTSAPTVTITPPFSGNAAIVASATSAGVADTGYNNYWSVTHSSLGVTIIDNDNAGVNVVATGGDTTVVEGGATDTVDISLRQQPAANVTVNLTASTQALVFPTTLTFTPANWNNAQTVTVTAINDTSVEADTLTNIGVVVDSNDIAYDGVKTKSIAATVIDNDFVPLGIGHSNGWTTVAEGGAVGNSTDTLVRASDTFTVNLGRTPTANVTVTLVTDGQISVSPSTLTFTTSNSGTNQTVTVTAVDDGVAETAMHNSLLRFVISSADPFYNNPRNTPMNIPVRDNDANGIALFETNGSTQPTEGGTDAVSVVLTKAPTSSVIVDLVSSNTAEATVPASLTFTTANWSTPQSFNVTAIGDMINEGREVYNVSVTARTTGSDAAYAGLTGWTYDGFKAVNNQVINYITDNHRRNENLIIVPSGGSIRSNDAQPTGGNTWVTEGSSETDSVEIYLASPPVIPVTVTLDANSQMAFNQSVFYFDSTNWNVPQTVVISAIDDAFNDVALAAAGNTAYNQAQNIQFRCFGDPTYLGIAPTHTVNILDNDAPAVSISQTGGITSTVEGGATDTYSIVLTTPPNGDVVITATPANTGTTLNNVTTGAKSFTFNASNWNVPQVVTVLAAQDTTVEGNHQVNVTHAINVALTTDTTGYAANTSGTSTLSLQTVVNNISDDDNRIIVNVTGLETRVHEDGSKSDTYSIVLRSAPSGANTVTITPSVTGGFAASGLSISPATLIFNSSNFSTPQFFTLTGVNNSIDAERARTVTISHTSASGDANFNAQTIHQVAVSQLSTDTPRIMFVGSPNIHENGNTGTYTVALNRAPTADVTVVATANSQLEIAPPVPAGGTLVYGPTATLTFTSANWMTHQTVTIRAIDDSLVESYIHYSGEVTHTSSSTDATYNNVSPLYKVVPLITDNEFPAVRIIPSGGTTVITESGTSDTYDIVLSQAPTADVTVTITPDAQSTVSSSSVTFTSGNWNVPQPITVTAMNDTATEVNHTSTITHGNATSADPAFNGLPVPLLIASITDDDGPQVQLVESGGNTTVVEAGANDTFTIGLSQAPTANVTVTFSPPVYIIPPPAYSKQVGYFTSDLSGSNQQKDRIVLDYTELIQLYRDTFYDHLESVYGTGAIPIVPSDVNLQNAHWAASKAIVDKTDLWWCGGSLKARNPVLIEPNQPAPVPLPPANPRQVLMECIYQINGGANSLGTTRYEPEIVFDPKNPPNTTFANEIRDRCRWIGYLNSTVMPGFVQH
ncbi:MAG: DUF1800 family protein [Verrucomicrobiaceae bacterium]|nr:DUF1800 family protein [Verrucomicrobiaceae bacterium]